MRNFGRAIYLCIGLAAVICYMIGRNHPSDFPSRDLLINLASELAGVAIIFFVVEEFFRWNPARTQQEELLIRWSGRIEDLIQQALSAPRASAYLMREEAYAAVAQTIIKVSQTEQGEKKLIIAALHGHAGKRRTILSFPNSTFDSFAREMAKCQMSSGSGKWNVRELYNVTDEDRLEMIVERIKQSGDAEGYEVRAFCLQNVLPQLTPLIVGKEDMFIGVDDQTYYGIRGAVHVRGEAFTRLATEYFDSLWNDPRAFFLRTGFGIDHSNIESLRKAVRALSANVSSSILAHEQTAPPDLLKQVRNRPKTKPG